MSHYIHDEKVKQLEELANKIRQSLIEELVEAKSGHTAGTLGVADVFVIGSGLFIAPNVGQAIQDFKSAISD